MKRIIIATLLGMILLTSFVKADQVNMEINVNGTANLNITVDADDTELRQDVWGTETGSGPRDIILNDIQNVANNPPLGTEGVDVPQTIQTIDQICDDPGLQNYLKQMGSLPSQGFIDYVKALGYDDETHISLIWTICQDKYIEENEEKWSTDIEGVSRKGISNMIEGAIEWLLGLNLSPLKEEVEIGRSLDRYFASDRDTSYLLKRLNELTLRVEALENTMNEVASEAYCRGKLKVMLDYDLQGVKCNETTYFNHQYSPTGEEMIIGITPVDGEEEKPKIPEEIPIEDNETEVNESVLLSEQGSSTETQTTTTTIDIKKIIHLGLNLPVPKPIEDFIMNAAILMSSFTITTTFLGLGWPAIKGHVLFRTGTKKRTNHIKTKNTRRSLKRNKR